MVLLDTDTVTHLHFRHPRVVERLLKVSEPEVGTTIVTKVEILRGRYDSLLKASDAQQLIRAQEQIDRSEQLLNEMLVVVFDNKSAREFDRIRGNRQLAKIGRGDLLIASIALAHKATLVTRNLRHFRQIPGIKLENWVD